MKTAARWVEILVGAFFLVSAGAKALDMEAFGVQISAYNVIKDAALVRGSAYFAVALETLLGAALVGGVRYAGLTHLVSAGMIAVYSTLIVYAWQFHGLEDCGCLGAWIVMGPIESLIKNAALVAFLGFAWFGGDGSKAATAGALPAGPPAKFTRPAAAAAMSAVLALAAYDLVTAPPVPSVPLAQTVIDPARPYARFAFHTGGETFNLGEGKHLVALLNALCKHCQSAVPDLNEMFLDDSLPDLVALMMGTPVEIKEFENLTSPLFATHGIDTPTFMELLGSSPPRLVYVVEGKAEKIWDWRHDVPSADVAAYFAKGGD